MIAKAKNAEILLVSRSIPQQKFFSSPPQWIFSLSQAVPSTVKTSSFSLDVTQQKILYFRRQRESCAATLLLLVSCLLPSSSHTQPPRFTPRLKMILHFIIHSEGNTN